MNELKRTNTKQIIRQEVINLLNTIPFYKIKIKDLTQQLHISRSTFYAYYDSIYDVVQEIEDDFISGLVSLDNLNLADSQYLRTAKTTTLRTIDYIYNNRDAFLALLGPNGDASFALRLRNRLKHGYSEMLKKMKCPENRCTLFSEFFAAGQIAATRYVASIGNNDDIEANKQFALTTHKIMFSSVKSML